jgi:hypothetical protein
LFFLARRRRSRKMRVAVFVFLKEEAEEECL